MDIITIAVTAAIAELSKKPVADAYEHLKAAIKQRFGQDGELPQALLALEQKPASEGRKQVLQEAVADSGAADCAEIIAAAQALLTQAQQGGKRVQQIVVGDCNAVAEGGSSASVSVQR